MRVLIADDQREVRSALRLLLEQQAAECTIIEAADRDDLLSEAGRVTPDIIIVDTELKGILLRDDQQSWRAFQSVIEELRDLCPAAKFIALTSRPDLHKPADEPTVEILISKADPPETLLDVIQEICC